jgi:hypothetical protein
MGPKPIKRSINIWLAQEVHYLAKHTAKSAATSSKSARDIIQYIGVDINYTDI